jgi:uncharacterized protein with GYD domain
MPKFLIVASYTPEGAKGVLSKGGGARRDAVEKTIADIGGHLESFHFAFGEDDAYVIADLPDNTAAAALGLTVGASGMASVRTIVLLTPDEVDRAAQQNVTYRGPGS